MSSQRSSRFLHLQLGQEIIYLLLSMALAAALVMATLLLQQRDDIPPSPPVTPPPIITLAEADGYFFATGSAELSPAFEERLLSQVVPRVLAYRRDYDADVLEVIGHTDEVPLSRTSSSNLDGQLLDYLDGVESSELRAADNTGLGMARAAAVARVLIADRRMSTFRILPLSGGQVIKPDDSIAEPGDSRDEESRRRIEIRLRRIRDEQGE